jgi:protocatechuate 3,4-dioxygenase beta subunit
MAGRKMRCGAVVVAVVTAAAGMRALVPAGKSFTFLQPGFTQQMFASTNSFLLRNGSLGGIAVLPGGDVVAAECLFSGTRLHRFNATTTVNKYGTALHVETLLPSGGGCGLVYHQDGTLYLNTKTTGLGITNVNPDTGAIIRKIASPTGNAVGIVVDPVTHHIVYTGTTCAPNGACTLYDLDPVTSVVTTFAQFTGTGPNAVAQVNGIYFDPSGAFLFLDNRTPVNRLTVVTRAGVVVQHVAMPSSSSQPVGIGFSANSPKFIITNNTDGTMQRFDFPSDDVTQVPTRTVFASGGYRGDLMQTGPDGCLYATQGGARYDNDYEEDGSVANSIVRICGSGGFVPPDGVPTWPPRIPMGTLRGTVRDTVSRVPLSLATVVVSTTGAIDVSTMTTSTGGYSFALAPATYDLTASAPNYSPTTVAGVVLTDLDDIVKDIDLMPLPGTLRGVVRNVAGTAVASATVLLSNGKSAKTDDSGRYTIKTIVPGNYDATISNTFYDTLTVTGIAVPINATATRDFTLTQTPGTIQGVVTDTAAKPLPGATVLLSNGLSATADTAGAYVFPSVMPGTYGAAVSAATYNTLAASGIVLLNAGSTTKNFSLTPTPGALQGVVTTAGGSPIASAMVKLSNGNSATTGASGQYALSSVTPGTYSATVTASNYDTGSAASIVIPNATTVTLDFSLTQTPGTLQGTVKNAAGTAIAGASVVLSNGASATTDVAGNYSIGSLMPGSHGVTVTASNYNVLTPPDVTIPNAGAVTANFVLLQTPGSLTGTVNDTSGAAIAGATVTLSTGAATTTSPTGAYTFASLAPATYGATVSAATFGRATAAAIVIPNNAAVTQDFTLTPLPGTLQGVVSDAAGAKIAGATVTLSTATVATVASVSTDLNGAYVFTNATPGIYTVAAAAPTYIAQTSTGVVMPNAGVITLNFSLSPQPGVLQGVVTDTAGAKVSGATVLLSNGASAITNAAGAYAFPAVTPGTYSATVSAATYTSLRAAGILIPNGGSAARDFTLTPLPGTLRGVVADPAGAPIAGATVLLSTGVSATTDAAGAFVFASLTPGAFGATVSATSYHSFTASGIVVPNAGSTTQNFTLTPMPGTLQGVVTSTAGTPIASATVQLIGGASVVTDAGGRYAFASLTPGAYSASVSAANYDPASATAIAIPLAGTTTYNFTLTQTPGTLQGAVTNAAGAVIASATVQIAGGPSIVTDASGRYVFPSVLPGTYSVSAIASNYNGATVTGIVIPNAGAVIRDFTLLQTPGTLTGVVYDTAGARLAGARVALTGGAFAISNASGVYTITSLSPGTYDATATLATYKASGASGLVIANGGTTTRDFKLTPMFGAIQGVVTDASGVTLAGAIVALSNDASMVTGATGAYAFTSLTPGSYSITVSAPMYIGQTAPGVIVTSAGTVTRNFALAPMPGSLRGVVSSAAGGAAIASATVSLSSGISTTTDTAGRYAFTLLTPGTYTATVTAPGASIDPCKAANAFFGLGQASGYTLLGIDVAGCSGTTMDVGDRSSLIAGDIGVGDSVDATLLGGTIQGKLAADPSASYTIKKRGGPIIQGGVTKASLSAAVSAAIAAADRLAKLPPTQKLTAVTRSITITGAGGVNVVAIRSLKIVNGTVTVKGSSSDIFVMNVAGKFELDASRVVLTGGVRACNILWNFTGSAISEANEVELENGAEAAGIFLALSRLVDLEDSTLDGQVLAGGQIEVWSSTIAATRGESRTVTATAYDTLTVSGMVIPPGTNVTKNFVLTPADPCRKANELFGLGPAGAFGLLGVGCETHKDLTAKCCDIFGNVGIGPDARDTLKTLSIAGNVTIDPDAFVEVRDVNASGRITTAALGDIVDAALAAAKRLGARKPTQALPAVTRSTTISGNGGTNVISLASVDLVAGTLTIQGTASDVFVINVAGKFELDGSQMRLTGGVRPCNILWNFADMKVTDKNEVELEKGLSVAGIFLASHRLIELRRATLAGSVIGGGKLRISTPTISRP